MSDWLHDLPVGWLAVVVFGCAYLSAAVTYAVVVEFPTSVWVRARAFSAGMFRVRSLRRRRGSPDRIQRFPGAHPG